MEASEKGKSFSFQSKNLKKKSETEFSAFLTAFPFNCLQTSLHTMSPPYVFVALSTFVQLCSLLSGSLPLLSHCVSMFVQLYRLLSNFVHFCPIVSPFLNASVNFCPIVSTFILLCPLLSDCFLWTLFTFIRGVPQLLFNPFLLFSELNSILVTYGAFSPLLNVEQTPH